MRNYTYILLLLTALLGWSCERQTESIPSTPVTTGVRLKLVHAAPDAAGIDLYVNGQKISAGLPSGASSTSAGTGTPTAITYGTTFPGLTANYAVVPSGQVSYTLSNPASTTAGSATTVATQTLALNDNTYYSLFVFGTGTQPQVMLIQDDFSQANDPNKFYVRFVNLVAGSTGYDLALSSGTTLFQNAAYQGVPTFIGIDAANNASFVFRAPGTTTSLGTVTLTGSSAGRVMTVFATGVAGKTGTQAPKINLYVSR